MDWIDLAHDRDQQKVLVNTVMNLQFPQNVWKFSNSWATVGFSRRSQLHGVGSSFQLQLSREEFK
jgi:hypothetical protein